jgi:hypothetical protein
VDLIANLVEGALLADPYTPLKARLLNTYQMTDVQKVEKLSQLLSLGIQKPSKLMAAMLKQEDLAFFTFFICTTSGESFESSS